MTLNQPQKWVLAIGGALALLALLFPYYVPAPGANDPGSWGHGVVGIHFLLTNDNPIIQINLGLMFVQILAILGGTLGGAWLLKSSR